jgi:CRP-like cAMP-binding protein
MPINRNYTPGSIVYFQGDMGDDVYVLQQGRVILTSTALDSGEEIKEEVQAGEFFGVKSAIGKYPREETAQVIGKTALITFKSTEFEGFVLKNTRLVMKMLRVFSKQLRNIHRQVRDLLKAGASRDPAYELLNVAESFFRSGNYDHAVYAFKKFMDIYPQSPFISRAVELCDLARQNHIYPIGYPALDTLAGNFSGPVVNIPGASPNKAGSSPIARGSATSLNEMLNSAMSLSEQKKYPEAIIILNQCLSMKTLNDQNDNDAYARAHFEKGKVEMKMMKLAEANASFSGYLKKFPTGEHVKESIYQLAIIAEAQKQTDRARQLLHKVATMPPPDKITQEARNRLTKLSAL